MKPLSPVIKWFGSKRPVAEEISKYFRPCATYFEPFVGGGSMLPFAKASKGYASDIIPELISLWNMIKEDPQTVANEYELRWDRLQKNGAEVYYQIRDEFNKTKNCLDFLFLTRTCVNGMIRYNAAGEFNNSFHLSRSGINPQTFRQIVLKWSNIIKNIHFLNVDYRECLSTAKKGDFVFLDPPYGGTKDRYTKQPFNLTEFYNELERLNSIGAYWMLTFDGSSGDRKYSFAPPSEVYKHRFSVQTGISAFSKVIDRKKEVISESVYLNFEPINQSLNLFDFFNQETGSLVGQQMQ